MNLRRAAQLDPLGQFVADVADRRGKPSDRALLLGLGAHDADVYARLLQVGRHAHFGDRDQAVDARVLQLAGQHDADFLPDFLGDAFVPMSRDRHCCLTGCRNLVESVQSHDCYSISSSWPTRSRPRCRSDPQARCARTVPDVPGIVREADDADLRALPGILPVQFGDGHIEFPPQPVLQAAQHLPLVFERMRIGNVDFQGEQTDRHRHPCGPAPRTGVHCRDRAPRSSTGSGRASASMSLLHREALEHVADLDVVEIGDARRRTQSRSALRWRRP